MALHLKAASFSCISAWRNVRLPRGRAFGGIHHDISPAALQVGVAVLSAGALVARHKFLHKLGGWGARRLGWEAALRSAAHGARFGAPHIGWQGSGAACVAGW